MAGEKGRPDGGGIEKMIRFNTRNRIAFIQ
jgi:hypothetical protein